MNLYYRNLRTIGILMILVSAGSLVYELALRRILTETNSAYIWYIPLYWGIWVKNSLGALAGALALLFYRGKKHYSAGTVTMVLLCVLEAAVIILSTAGSAGQRTNGLIDLTMLMMIVLVYTLSQTDRDLKQWKKVSALEAAELDLRLPDPAGFFDPVQAGPRMAINGEYASAVNRFLASDGPVPLKINFLCPGRVPEMMRDTIREVFAVYYETEEKRISKELERKYRRVILLFVVSLLSIGILRQITLFDEDTIIWEVIGNFAAFGLWQIGYVHYERDEGFDELLLVQCAKYAELNFLEKKGARS